jgi:hypothetical protein
MSNYRKLSLPPIFLDTTKLLEIRRTNIVRGYACVLTDFIDILNPELTDIFQQLGAIPTLMISFGHEKNVNFKPNYNVHADVYNQGNKWVKVPFAINWELTDTPVEFKWYDVKGVTECYPPEIKDADEGHLLANGIHYGERWPKDGVPAHYKFEPIETFKFEQHNPVMIKTSEPHAVLYSGYDSRLNVSLRFNIKDIPTWDHAIDRFSEYIL